jgi:hypothetical protein
MSKLRVHGRVPVGHGHCVGTFPIRLPLVNQSVISTPNVFSTLRPSLLADI